MKIFQYILIGLLSLLFLPLILSGDLTVAIAGVLLYVPGLALIIWWIKRTRNEQSPDDSSGSGLSIDPERSHLFKTACAAFVSEEGLHQLDEVLGASITSDESTVLVQAWKSSVQMLTDFDGISEDQESHLLSVAEKYHISEGVKSSPQWDLLGEARAIRMIQNGYLPDNSPNVDGHIPFNLMKSEQLVWLFPESEYLIETTKREFVGGSVGASVRVAKGLYLRSSAFKGRPVNRAVTVSKGSGILGITTKHIYFTGTSDSFRIRYSKIVSFQPSENAITIMRDTASAKPETFVNGDGWFIYNLVTNLSHEPELRL